VLLDIIIIGIALLASAFFSGVETAVMGLTPLNLVRGHSKNLYNLYQKKDKLIATCLIGNNLSIVGGTLALDAITSTLDLGIGRVFAFLIQLLLFFILAEVLPKAIFRRMDSFLLSKLYLLIYFFYYLFYGLTYTFLVISKLFFKFIPDLSKFKKEDIFYFVASNIIEQTAISEALLHLETSYAKEIMTPLIDIASLDKNATVKDAILLLEKTSYSRYPVHDNNRDNIIGYIRIEDIIDLRHGDSILKIMYESTFVPEMLPVDKLLIRMRREKIPITFVVSEFGTTMGLITIEGIAEELVGEIVSFEQVRESEDIVTINSKLFLLDGSLDVADFNEYFNHNIVKNHFSTIAGYLLSILGDFPQVNDIIDTNEGRFEIKQADVKVVHKIKYIPKK